MINLFVNYYKTVNDERQQEIDKCLQNNLENDLIDRVIVFGEAKIPFVSNKLYEASTVTRPTYQDFFNETKLYGEDDINIISNSDIYFNDTIKAVLPMCKDVCYALTRTEVRNGNLVHFSDVHLGCPAHFSQDTWIFKGHVLIEGCDKVIAQNVINHSYEEIPFTLGVPGCDNVIASKIGMKYRLKNPNTIVQCVHLHANTGRPKYQFRITGDYSRWGKLKRVEESQL